MDETLYDRDISWLDFNMRVLELAESENTVNGEIKIL